MLLYSTDAAQLPALDNSRTERKLTLGQPDSQERNSGETTQLETSTVSPDISCLGSHVAYRWNIEES